MKFLDVVFKCVSGHEQQQQQQQQQQQEQGSSELSSSQPTGRRRGRHNKLRLFDLSDTTFNADGWQSDARHNRERDERESTEHASHSERAGTRNSTSTMSSSQSSFSCRSSSTSAMDPVSVETPISMGQRRRLQTDAELLMNSEDLLCHVCSFLDVPDLIVVQSLNKMWSKVSTSNQIWRPLLMRFLRDRDSQQRAKRCHFVITNSPQNSHTYQDGVDEDTIAAADVDFSTYNYNQKNSFNSKLLRAASDPINDYHQQFIIDTSPKGDSRTCTPRDTPTDKRVRSYARNYLVNNNVDLSKVKMEKMSYLFQAPREFLLGGRTPYDSILIENAKKNPLSRLPAFGFNGDSRTVYERDCDFLCAMYDLSYRQMFILSKTQGPTRWLKRRPSALNRGPQSDSTGEPVPVLEAHSMSATSVPEFVQSRQMMSYHSNSSSTSPNDSPRRRSFPRKLIPKWRRHHSSPEGLGSSFQDGSQQQQQQSVPDRPRQFPRQPQPLLLPDIQQQQQLTVAAASAAATTMWSSSSFEYHVTLLMLGDAGVGKSNICLRFSEDSFVDNAEAGNEFVFRTVTDCVTGTRAEIQIFDPEKLVPPRYYKQAQGIALVFDLTKYNSFSNLMTWFLELARHTGQEPQSMILIGNKADMVDQREVNFLEAMAFSYKHKMQYFETSAKTGFNVDLAICSLLNLCLKKDQGSYNLFGMKPYYKPGNPGESSRESSVRLGFRYAASSAACL